MLKQLINIIKMFNIYLNVLVLWYITLGVIPDTDRILRKLFDQILPDAIHHRYANVFYGPQ